MAAPGNSRGVKIAVAIFAPLTLALLATSCLSYAAYASAVAAELSAKSDRIAAVTEYREVVANYEELRRRIGARKGEHTQVIDEINTRFKKIDEELTVMAKAADTLVGKAQVKGAPEQELEEIRSQARRLAASYRGDPEKTFISSLEQLTRLMGNQSLSTTRLSLDYLEVRRALEAASNMTKAQVDVVSRAAHDARDNLLLEQQKHAEEGMIILLKLDELQNANDKQAAEIAGLTAKMKRQQEDFRRDTEIQATLVHELCDAVNSIAKKRNQP